MEQALQADLKKAEIYSVFFPSRRGMLQRSKNCKLILKLPRVRLQPWHQLLKSAMSSSSGCQAHDQLLQQLSRQLRQRSFNCKHRYAAYASSMHAMLVQMKLLAEAFSLQAQVCFMRIFHAFNACADDLADCNC